MYLVCHTPYPSVCHLFPCFNTHANTPGISKALPEGFQGLVLKRTGHSSANTSTSDAQQRSWQAVGRVTQLVLWGHDVAPAAADPHMRCIDWLALADHVRLVRHVVTRCSRTS